MRSFTASVILSSLAVLFFFANGYSWEKQEMSRSFEGKEIIEINTVSGDCVVQVGRTDEIQVHLGYSISPPDAFEPRFKERGDVLRLSEKLYGSSSGRSTWTLVVPEETRIEFSSASGGLTVEGLRASISADVASGDISLADCIGEFDINTASGDIEVENCQGEFDLETASGDIDVDHCEGEFDLNVASGDVKASEVLIDDESSFTTASGAVYVRLAETPAYDLTLSSASGKAVLDYRGNPVKGHFELVAKADGGSIRAPFKPDSEKSFRQWGRKYIRKSFTRDSDTPEIVIETASGRAELRE